MRSFTEKIVLSAVLVALGIALQIIESMIPMAVNIPGGKLGLANIVTLILIYVLDKKTAFICAILRAFLGSILYGGVSSVIYSVSGAAFSFVMMCAAIHIGKEHLSEVGVSVIGAVSHSSAQVCVSAIVLSNVFIFTYLPILCIASCITGVFTGYAAKAAIAYLKKQIR